MLSRRQQLYQIALTLLSFSFLPFSLALPSHDHTLALFNAPASNAPLTPPPLDLSNPPPLVHKTVIAPTKIHTLKARARVGFQNFLNLGAGWNMYYSSWNAIALPVQLASLDLIRLYSTIIANAAGVWRVAPPRYMLLPLYSPRPGVRLVMVIIGKLLTASFLVGKIYKSPSATSNFCGIALNKLYRGIWWKCLGGNCCRLRRPGGRGFIGLC